MSGTIAMALARAVMMHLWLLMILMVPQMGRQCCLPDNGILVLSIVKLCIEIVENVSEYNVIAATCCVRFELESILMHLKIES